MALSGPSLRELCILRKLSLITAAVIAVSLFGSVRAAEAVTNKRIAVLMFVPQNLTPWVDAATVRNVVWTGGGSSNAFYKEESFGKWALTGTLDATNGDVFGWYTVPYSDIGKCISATWISSAKASAAKQGFVETNYDALIYVSRATGCPGRAWTSGKVVTVVNGFNAPTVSHELGHAFGLAHASAWLCKDALGVKVPISTSCGVDEYGDFAVMGSTTSYHMNNFHKGALGWLAASNTKDVTADGVYALYSIEKATTYAQVLRIVRKTDLTGNPLDYFYLEFRQTYGFDNFTLTNPKVTGISIRVAPSYSYKSSHTYLLDATTPALTNFSDAQLLIGGTFNDPTRRVNITLLSIVGGAAQVLVDFY
jgi:hypothetical protein